MYYRRVAGGQLSGNGGWKNVRRRGRIAIWGAGGASALVAAAGAGLLVAAPPAHGQADPGVGSSYAQSIQDTPKDGSLSVGAVLGEALAGHTNNVARAQSQGLDETAIGSSLQGYNCGTAPSPAQLSLVSQPLQAETGQDGADQGFTVTPTTGLDKLGPNTLAPPSFGSTEFVKATGTPYGEADTSYATIAVPGAPFSMSGLYSKAWSGLVNGQRVAAATEDIKSISLVSGMVVLNGLHWEATYPSGGAGTPSATFTIGSLTINNTPVPTSNPLGALDAVNTALDQVGLHLGVPTFSNQQGIVSVSPLELDVVPNTARDNIIDPVVSGAQPVTGPLASGLENGFSAQEPAQIQQALCQSDTPITVADIAIASVDGAGSYVTSFGGVNASSGNAPANPFNLSLPSFGLGTSQSQFIPGTAGTPGSAAVAAASGLSGAGGATTGTGSTSAPAPVAPSSSGGASSSTAPSGAPLQRTEAIAATGISPGGPLLGIGLGAMGALVLLAEGDRRLMRRAQRGRASFDVFDD
jgi:collagen type VII alpha